MSELNELIASEIADFFAGFGGPGEPDIQSGEAQRLLTERVLSVLALRERAEPVAGNAAEFGDAYQGAREDLQIWKRRALEAEGEARRLAEINDYLVLQAQGEHRFGEPVVREPGALLHCAEQLHNGGTALYTAPPAPVVPMQPLVIDAKGTLRFKENPIVRKLLDYSTGHGYGLNEMVLEKFDAEDRMQLAQLIGYSLSGYGSLSYVTDESYARAAVLAAPGKTLGSKHKDVYL
ncbi:hypothetical protein [Cronobacter sakazakii]|uniref:hypothetical protein n=1 Tax=Cronobacter sakazakii TaxID=28141 RepID=UPI001F3BD999|nr:hypothetical protein [Cronobacter sakazakii]